MTGTSLWGYKWNSSEMCQRGLPKFFDSAYFFHSTIQCSDIQLPSIRSREAGGRVNRMEWVSNRQVSELSKPNIPHVCLLLHTRLFLMAGLMVASQYSDGFVPKRCLLTVPTRGGPCLFVIVIFDERGKLAMFWWPLTPSHCTFCLAYCWRARAGRIKWRRTERDVNVWSSAT